MVIDQGAGWEFCLPVGPHFSLLLPRIVTPREIKPQQLRALLLLLVLVPLIPTALMIRFMIDAADGERGVALEKMGAAYQQTLTNASGAFKRHLSAREELPTPRDVHDFYRALLDREVVVRIADFEGKALTGLSIAPRKILAQSSLRAFQLPWIVQVYLLDETRAETLLRDQLHLYTWTIGVAVLAIFTIAAAAALTVNQQLTVRELRNTAVATVAHELRTPLASIRMFVDTLREGRYRSAEQMREYLDLIAAENLRLSRLTENFLTLSRLERRSHELEFSAIPASEIAAHAAQVLAPQLEAPGCVFTLEAPPGLPSLRADRDAVLTTLLNLLDNALKYTGPEKRILLRAVAEPGKVRFTVEDNGVGVDPAEQRRIFQPFYQTDQKLSRTRGGCGLGLSIVREIVEAHRGQFSVEAAADGGSRFHVLFPTV